MNVHAHWRQSVWLPVAIVGAALSLGTPAASGTGPGEQAQGARLFGRACGACHTRVPGDHRTGPSLAQVVGRKAGTAQGFRRYSPALKASDIVWDAATLDPWIADPQVFIPGNRMTFPGLKDAKARADLIAYLAQAEPVSAEAAPGGMMGMGGTPPDLETAGPEYEVTAIRYCADTYEVTTADGTVEPFWEFNLRFKTDSSAHGPAPGKPAIVGAGMMGDRAAVVFAAPHEISRFITAGC
jgi:cytochrome c